MTAVARVNTTALRSPADGPAEAQADQARWPRLLLVHPNQTVHERVAAALRPYRIDAAFARDAVEGCRIAEDRELDLIIAQNRTINGDAQYLLWRLRTKLETAQTPVVIGLDYYFEEAEGRQLTEPINGHGGAQAVVAKLFAPDASEPFEQSALFATICRFVPSIRKGALAEAQAADPLRGAA